MNRKMESRSAGLWKEHYFFFRGNAVSSLVVEDSLTVTVLICKHLMNHVDCIMWLSLLVTMPLFSVHSFSILVIEEKENTFSL